MELVQDPPTPPGGNLTERLDGLLAASVDGGRVPGVVAAVVDRDGVVYEGAFGVRSTATGDPMTVDTVLQVASQTKSLTGIACLQAVDAGLLDLDAPASEVLPELGDLEVLEGFDGDGQPILRPAVGQVTLRQLLTHTSGFVYEFWNADCLRWLEATGTPGLTTGRVDSLRRPLAFDPGTDVGYGIGPEWAGRVLEAVTGRRLGEVLADGILGPLGMDDTGYAATPWMSDRLATTHFAPSPDARTGDLMPLPPTEEPWEYDSGGAGVLSTVPDFCRFVRMVLNDGVLDDGDRPRERILAADTLAAACRNSIGELRFIHETSAVAAVSNDFEYLPGVPKTWGLSWVVNEEAGPSGRSPDSVFGAGLFNTWFWADRTTGLGGVFATQMLPYFHPPAWDLYCAFEAEAYRL